MNNYWDTNYAAGQGGDFTFRYVLTSGAHLQNRRVEPPGMGRDDARRSRPDHVAGQSSQHPAAPGRGPGQLRSVDQPNVVLVTWKMAEDGDGTVMRFLEVGGEAKQVEVQTPHLNVKAAWSADALERKQAPLETLDHGFRFSVKPFQIVTVRLRAAGNVR